MSDHDTTIAIPQSVTTKSGAASRQFWESQNYLPTVLETAYASARQLAAIETGLAVEQFPVGCEYTIGQMLDAAYLPE